MSLETRSGLLAPKSYWMAADGEREKYCNGCGPEGWLGEMVPETIWGLRVSAACNIHDWMYCAGVTDNDRGDADTVFFSNILVLIDQASERSLFGWMISPLRRWRAWSYYEAVLMCGAEAFKQARFDPDFDWTIDQYIAERAAAEFSNSTDSDYEITERGTDAGS